MAPHQPLTAIHDALVARAQPRGYPNGPSTSKVSLQPRNNTGLVHREVASVMAED